MITNNEKIEKKEPNISQCILDYLFNLGIKKIFTVPGAHIDFFLVQAINDGRFEIILASHEQGAGYMADGAARMSGSPSIVATINGPGASNLITSAVTARLGNSPVIFLTGDIPSHLYGYGGFQGSDPISSNTKEIFIAAITNSHTIFNYTDFIEITNLTNNLVSTFPRRPVHWNLPNDVAMTSVPKRIALPNNSYNDGNNIPLSPEWLPIIPSSSGSKILLYVGNEIENPQEIKEIALFSKKYSIPIVVSFGAKNIQPFIDDNLFFGVFGYAGGPRAFKAMLDPTLETLLIFGVVLNERNTYAWSNEFYASNRKIIRFSNNNKSIRKSSIYIHEIKSNPIEAIKGIDIYWGKKESLISQDYNNRNKWIEELMLIPRIPPTVIKQNQSGKYGIYLGQAISFMNDHLKPDTPFFLDSGNHRIYGGAFWEVKTVNTFFSASQNAPMGWAIGAAIGASFVDKNKQIWVLTGDGCMQMHGMELAIAAKYHCKVIIVVSNNKSYGRVSARLKKIPLHVVNQLTSLPNISWVQFAESFGVPGKQVITIEELKSVIMEIQDFKGPYLIDLITDPEEPYPFSQAIFSSSTQITD